MWVRQRGGGGEALNWGGFCQSHGGPKKGGQSTISRTSEGGTQRNVVPKEESRHKLQRKGSQKKSAGENSLTKGEKPPEGKQRKKDGPNKGHCIREKNNTSEEDRSCLFYWVKGKRIFSTRAAGSYTRNKKR